MFGLLFLYNVYISKLILLFVCFQQQVARPSKSILVWFKILQEDDMDMDESDDNNNNNNKKKKQNLRNFRKVNRKKNKK